jgi:hypothetical protein
MAEQRRFAGLSTRTELRAANNLGIVRRTPGSDKLRRRDLDIFDAYYEGRQYDSLSPWDSSQGPDGTFIPVRQRKPRIILNLAKTLSSRLTAKLVGSRTFPEFKIEDDPDTEELIRQVIRVSRLKGGIIEPIRRMVNSGSVFVRFFMVNGQYKIQHYLSKYTFPVFDPAGNLIAVTIQFVWEDKQDIDPTTKQPKKKWFRLDLNQQADISYDTPPFEEGSEPQFQVVEQVEHQLGFVQGEWFKTAEMVNSPDGPSIIMDSLDSIDELNYNVSQSSTAVQYNQDPLLAIKNMDEDEMDEILRTSFKAMNLGRDGEAAFVESSMNGVQTAMEFRDKVSQNMQEIVRVVMLDPEKIVGSAQSAKAMEVLHGPMVELVEEMRPTVEKSLINLVLKMTVALLIQAQRGAPTPVILPPGFTPKSVAITVLWPEIFPMTMQDLQQKVQVASVASSANLVSRETLTKWLAKDFGIEDLEAEIQKIADQPVINPFGAF